MTGSQGTPAAMKLKIPGDLLRLVDILLKAFSRLY